MTAMRLGFACNDLDRGLEERDEETLGRALAVPGARVFLRSGPRWLLNADGGPEPVDFALAEAEALGGDLAQAALLGWSRADGAPYLALDLATVEAGEDGRPALDLRTAASENALPPGTEGALAQGAHLLNWHRTARFCGVCGAPTVSALAGARRDCTACGHMQFPRTDPVVIMLVHDGAGSCVLGRQARFAPGTFSCLAGFAEPGETIEDAVRREVREEVGLEVGRVDYRLSQPWPFPSSLMIGCVAEARREALRVQESELEAARWFSRDEVAAMLDGRHPDGLSMPPGFAIAHHLAALWAAPSAER